MEQRLANIERDQARTLALLEALAEKVDERIEADDGRYHRLIRTVYGDGNGHRGHSVRLDRLEQAQDRSKWFTRTVGGALIGVAVLAAWAILSAA